VNMSRKGTLAARLGVTSHVSVLRRKLERLARAFPSGSSESVEEWLVDVANERGAGIVTREVSLRWPERPPKRRELPDEELVAGLCLLQSLDRPHMFRLAGQLVSRGELDTSSLILLGRRERLEGILGTLARQALRVQPDHPAWQVLGGAFGDARPLREPLLHWTRLAEPIPVNGRCNAGAWKLVR